MAGGVTLAFGAVGAAIGSAFGNPMAGAKIGLMVGALVDPGPQNDPGRTRDLRFGGSSMGASVPIVWGKARVPATLFWAATNPDGSIYDLGAGGKGKAGGKGGNTPHAQFTFAGSGCMGSMYAPDGSSTTRNPIVNKIWGGDIVMWNRTDTAHATAPSFHPSGGETFENQTADSTISTFLLSNTPTYRGLLYWVFSALDCFDFGNSLPTFTTEVQTDAVDVADIVGDICFMAGIPSSALELSAGVGVMVDGYVCLSSMTWQDAISNLLLPLGFDLVKHTGKLRLVLRGGAVSKTIPASDLGASRNRTDSSSSLSVETGHFIDQFTVCELSYFDTGSNYENGIAASPYVETGLSPNKWRVSTNLCLNNLKARQISSYLMDTARVEIEGTAIKFKLSWAYLDVVASDALVIPWADDPTTGQLSDTLTKRVRVTEAQIMAGSDEGLLEITAVRDEAGVMDQSAIVGGSGGSGAVNVKAVGTQAVAVDFLAVSPAGGLFDADQNASLGVLVVANSTALRWAAQAWYSVDGTHYLDGGPVAARGVWGALQSGGVPADWAGMVGGADTSSTVKVLPDTDALNLATSLPGSYLAAGAGNVNRWLVGGELITASVVTGPVSSVYTLGGGGGSLYRAWRGSPATGHTAGENVVWLGDLSGSRSRPYLFIPINPAFATSVTTGASSATQTVGSTAGMAAGTVLFFATAGVSRTVSSVTSATVVVLTSSVASTTGEAVTWTITSVKVKVLGYGQTLTDVTALTVTLASQVMGPNGMPVMPTSVSSSPAWPSSPASEVVTYAPVFATSVNTPQTFDWEYATSSDGVTWSSWSAFVNTPGPFMGPAFTSGYQKAQVRATNSNGQSAWVSSSSVMFMAGSVSAIGTPFYQTFNGNGSTTAFTLSHAPSAGALIFIYVGGSLQLPGDDYSISGTTLTFVLAPIAGTKNIDVRYFY